ncbi:flavonol synthase/flavanone 3-hydroxylase-like isoform X2 [Olea europaea var. sylvestris]|nr:flavonol synthase/flavanone 3-hydroxylase-like isoform X2 [Olea europaea var. sylvestris]
MENLDIPTVDFSPFFTDSDEDGKKNAVGIIKEACSNYGFFQIFNHGIPRDLINRALKFSGTFFALPDEEKVKYIRGLGAPLPAGYNKQPEHSADKNEYLLMFPPRSTFNVLPSNPPEFREVLEELFTYFARTGELIERILNDCLGLPPNFLKEFNNDRSWDFMVALRYFPATGTENNGLSEHEDGNCVTFVIQDEVGGLEVRKDGEWIPVIPAEGSVVVNIGDVIQVHNLKTGFIFRRMRY